jgi:hypothetical protein
LNNFACFFSVNPSFSVLFPDLAWDPKKTEEVFFPNKMKENMERIGLSDIKVYNYDK